MRKSIIIASVVLTIAGCGDSHDVGTGDGGATCTGSPFRCSDVVDFAGPGCCGDLPPRDAVCGPDGEWVCPPGWTDTCTGYWLTDRCASSGPSYCTENTDCVVISQSCCGMCGAATPEDMMGVNRDRIMDRRDVACADGIDCPACFAEQDPHLVATCSSNTCSAMDLSTRDITACTSDAECVLRLPECCACGTLDTPIAINVAQESALQGLLCDPMAACPECAPDWPDLGAVCDPDGHCQVVDLATPPPGG